MLRSATLRHKGIVSVAPIPTLIERIAAGIRAGKSARNWAISDSKNSFANSLYGTLNREDPAQTADKVHPLSMPPSSPPIMTSATQRETENVGCGSKLVHTIVPSTGTAGTALSVTVRLSKATGRRNAKQNPGGVDVNERK